MMAAILVAEAHTAEPAAKQITAANKTIFRPQISESPPHTGVAAAQANR